MEYFDLLNALASYEKTLKAKVSAFILNEIDASAFLRDGVSVSDDVKFVQVRSTSIRVDKADYFMEAWFYASVPKSLEVGTFCYLEGRFSNLSQHAYSKEVTLFDFKGVKEGGYTRWTIHPCRVISWSRSPVKDANLKRNIDYWKEYPYTLSSGRDNIITPITRMVEQEVMMDFNNALVGNKFEFPKLPEVEFSELTALQTGCLREMLMSPVLQVQVENENLISVENLVKEIKSVQGISVVVYDLRIKKVSPKSVVDKLKSAGALVETGSRYILLVSDIVHGIPSLVLGSENLV